MGCFFFLFFYMSAPSGVIQYNAYCLGKYIHTYARSKSECISSLSGCVISSTVLTWNHLACRSEVSAAWHFCLSRPPSSSSSSFSLLMSWSPSSGERYRIRQDRLSTTRPTSHTHTDIQAAGLDSYLLGKPTDLTE